MTPTKPRFSPKFEEFAVRVMYFMTTIDSYVPLAALTSFVAVTVIAGVFAWSWWLPLSFALTLAAFHLADYYPTFVAAVPVWIATRGPRPSGSQAMNASAPPIEIATAFVPLAYSAVPLTGARVVRLEVPRTALTAFGLTPLDAVEDTRTGTVLADVVVGDDGLARAVRFVRAARAPGVTP